MHINMLVLCKSLNNGLTIVRFIYFKVLKDIKSCKYCILFVDDGL